MSPNPLIEKLIAVDNQMRLLMRHAGTRRQKAELCDALQALRASVLDVVAAQAAAGAAELDVEDFKAIIRLAAQRGQWGDFAFAFNQVGMEPRP
jgi:hypothetical protein